MSKHEPISAMREALREIANCSQVLQGSILDDPNTNAKNAAKRFAGTIQELAESAMRLPLRNCDRFESASVALAAYLVYEKAFIMRSNNVFDRPLPIDEWLFETEFPIPAEGEK